MADEITQRDTTGSRPDVLDGVSRRTLLKASGVGAGGLALGASASPATAQQEEDDEEDEDDQNADRPDFRVPYLDRDTLQAEFEGETLQAESTEERRPGSTTYVGEAADRPGLFVAVSHRDEDSDEPDEDENPVDIGVYLCDGEVGTRSSIGLWLTGEFDETGTTLSHEAVEGVEVKLALVDGDFLGAVVFSDEDGTEEVLFQFVATESTGDAGLYGAESELHSANDEPLTLRWVVLSDGRQRGIFDTVFIMEEEGQPQIE